MKTTDLLKIMVNNFAGILIILTILSVVIDPGHSDSMINVGHVKAGIASGNDTANDAPFMSESFALIGQILTITKKQLPTVTSTAYSCITYSLSLTRAVIITQHPNLIGIIQE